jgi:hypothetical protein
VTRPDASSPDVDVTLAATITLNGQQTMKTFVVTVRSLAPPTPVAAYEFESGLDDSTGAFGPGSTQPTMLWSGTAWFDGSFNSSIPGGSWSHLVMTVNHGALRLYLNGALVNTMSNFPDVFSPAAATRFALGVNHWDTPYVGWIDQLKIYDEAIEADVVQQLHAEGQ